MGPLPDRFLAYLIEGEREAFVVGDGAIARHERQQALGSVGAILLLAEGRPVGPEAASRVRLLLRTLARPFRFRAARIRTEALAVPFEVDAMVASREPMPDSGWEAAFTGLREISGRSRPSIALAASSPPQSVRSNGLELIVRPGPNDGDRVGWLELELRYTDGTGPGDSSALVWSSPDDPQRTRFDPAGIARLRWPAAARSTLRIDAGAHTALFELQTTT